MSRKLKLKALVVALGLAAGPIAFAATSPPPLANTAIVTPATRLRPTDTVVGPVALSKSMRVTLSLNWRNAAHLKAFLANPDHAKLSHAQFLAQYGPAVAKVDRVKAYLRRQGFHDIEVSPNRLLVSGEGSAATVQAAFHTSLIKVRTGHGRLAFANSTAARIPASLRDIVHAILGLQTVHRFHVMPVTAETAGTPTAHEPVDFAKIYDASGTAAASSIPVGIITAGSMHNVENDFKLFLRQNGLPAIPMHVVKVGGGGTSTLNDAEWDLDSQDIVGMAGGVKALYLYDGASLANAELLADFNTAVSDDVVRAVNVSIGECETAAERDGTAATGDAIFEEADAEGITFSASTGDTGADECGIGGIIPSWPASSPYVVAVGGTELYTTGERNTIWAAETAWNNLSQNSGATGGSPSTFEPIPSWQRGVGQNAGHATRGLPDVAFAASPFTGSLVIVDEQLEQIGGTSLASPLFVGTWARTLEAHPGLGFAAPWIYRDAASHYASDFHDVTHGNNDGEVAAPGWDYTTGFGSIKVASFITHVATASGTSPTPPVPAPPPPPPPPPHSHTG